MSTMSEAAGERRKKTSLQLYFERLMHEHPKGAYYSYFQKRIQPILDRKRLEKLEKSKIPPPLTTLPNRLPELPTPQELARTRKRWKLNAKLIPPAWTKRTSAPSTETPKLGSSTPFRDRSPEVHQLIFETDPSERLETRALRKSPPKYISHRMTEFLTKNWNLILVLISAFVICCLIVVRRKRRKGFAIRSTYGGSCLCRGARQRPKVKRRRRVTKRCPGIL